MDKFELHGLLLLDSGQEFLEVVTLLRDVDVLHPLLLAAVTADKLWPLFSVLCCDVLYLLTHTGVTFDQSHGLFRRKPAGKGTLEQKCGERTLALCSVASVWILSSVSFFSSWQLFSLKVTCTQVSSNSSLCYIEKKVHITQQSECHIILINLSHLTLY